MSRTFGEVSPEKEKELSGKFEELIKTGEVKEGTFVYLGSMPAIIQKIEGGKIEFLRPDDIGIHDDPDLTESNIISISELEEDFKNGELTIMPKSEIDELIESEIEDLKHNADRLFVKGKSNIENAAIREERLKYYESLV